MSMLGFNAIYLHKIDIWMKHALERRLHVVTLYLAFPPTYGLIFSPFAFPRCFNDRWFHPCIYLLIYSPVWLVVCLSVGV